MAAKIPLKDQICELELTVVNRRGFISTLKDLVRRKERPQHDLDYQAGRLPALEAAVTTLKWVEANQDLIRQVHSKTAKSLK